MPLALVVALTGCHGLLTFTASPVTRSDSAVERPGADGEGRDAPADAPATDGAHDRASTELAGKDLGAGDLGARDLILGPDVYPTIKWTVQTQPSPLHAVWVSPTGQLWVAGQGVISDLSGLTFGSGQLWRGIAGHASDVCAVGNGVKACKSSGWSEQSVPGSPDLRAVWASSSTFYAAGTKGVLIDLGTGQTVLKGTGSSTCFGASASFSALYGVESSKGLRLFTVTEAQDICQYDAGNATWLKNLPAPGMGICAWDGDSLVAVGGGTQGVIAERYAGSWLSTLTYTSGLSAITGVWGASVDPFFFTSADGHVVWVSGSSTRHMLHMWPAGLSTNFRAVSGGGGKVYVVGYDGSAGVVAQAPLP